MPPINGLLGVGIARHTLPEEGREGERKTVWIQNGAKAHFRKGDFLVGGGEEEERRRSHFTRSLRRGLANILPGNHGTKVLTEALRPSSSCPTGNRARQ